MSRAAPTCTLNTGDLWCGVVTVEAYTPSGFTAYGFNSVIGALSDTALPVGTNDYTIDGVWTGAGGNAGVLSFSLTSALTDADKAKLVLHIDDSSDTFAFSDAGGPSSANTYDWASTGLDWSSESEVTLRVREAATPPDATLSGLTVTAGGTDLVTFASGTKTYTAMVANDVAEVTVTPTTNDSGATVAYLDGDDATITDADTGVDGHQVTLAEGDNVIKVKVTAEDGSTETYTVTVSRAEAASTCTLNTGDGDIWCGVVTVEAYTAFGLTNTYGFVSDPLGAGALSDTGFSVGTNPYTIDWVIVTSGELSFSVNGSLTTADRAKLVLHIDGNIASFAFSDASFVDASYTYKWSGSGLDWSSESEVTLRLRALPDAPTEFTATLGNAEVALAWDAPGPDSGVTGYEYSYKTTGDYLENWTAIADSAVGAVNEASFTVTGLTNGTEYTFQLRAVSAAGNGDAAEAGPVTPMLGICDRTAKIQEVILDEISGVDNCAAVTAANLAAITSFGFIGLNTASEGISSLQKGDFAGLTSLTILDLGSNGLTSLPDGVFSGLTALTELSLNNNNLSSLPEDLFLGLASLGTLDLGSNSNTLPLTVTVEKVGTNQVRAKVLAGTPFAANIPVTLVNGTLTGSVTELSVAAGEVYSEPVTMTRTAGMTTAATVDVDLTTQPTLPSNHRGYEFKKATVNLPATILPDATNAAPAFTSSATFNPAENQTAVGTVEADDSDTTDEITGYALNGGADQALFSITSGVLTFQAAPNYEDPQDADTDNAYVVVVRATSGTGARVKTMDQTITVTVMDVDEPPAAPGAPTVSATSGSTTSLDVSWTAPANTGKPAITSYDLRYRVGDRGSWTDGPQDETGTTAAISALAADTEHQVQVRASNDEGDSGWSAAGMGSTNADTDTPTVEPGELEDRIQAINCALDALDGESDERCEDIESMPGSNRDLVALQLEVISQLPPGKYDYYDLAGWQTLYKMENGRVIITKVGAAGPAPLTARLEGVPEAHDGETAFNFRVAFSEDIGIDEQSLRDHSFTVSGGEVTGAQRDRHDLWEITVAPDSDGDVTITLPGDRECGTAGAVCTRGDDPSPLTNSPSATVAGPADDARDPNTAATGTPTISGTAQVGETLTADTPGIADDDGLENVSFSYLWLADDTAIQGATNSTYTLIETDEGKAITVQVSFTDDAGNDESLTSAATDAVAAKPNSPATGAPTISGTAQVGEALTADTSGIEDADGLDAVTFSYQWLAGDSDISGATGSAYTLADADEGKTVKVRVSFTDDGGNDETLTSAATEAVEAAPNSPATGAPTISGTAQVGETLTADTSSIADADGLDAAAFSYQWLADDTEVAGATGSTYTLVEADEGKTVKVRVSFTDDASNEETLTSAATDAVAGNEESAVAGNEEPVAREDAAAWSATMTVEWVYQGYGYYSTDTKKAGSLSPASFEADGTTYTVKMVETQGWWTYIGTDRELPFDFVLELDGTRFASGDASFNSYSYGNIYRWEGTGLSLSDGDAVEVRLLRASEDETAVNSAATGAPVISGTVQVGETLTADTSGIADEDGLDNAAFTYQWLAGDTEIQGATNADYIPADADEGKTVKVQVTFTDDAGNDETLTSEATDAVSAATQPNSPATGQPTISGTAQVGETLTADTSGIADTDGLTTATLSYQWLADDAEIAGATGSAYTLADADEGKAITVQVSFTDDAGNDETLTSGATGAVATAEPSGPPARPTGLTAEVSHDSVTLTWDDPNDDTITGYVILRRDKDIHEEGTFETVESDTGSAGTTYTDDTVEAEKQYVYRIKAINADGLSEISSWVRAHTPAAPAPEPTQEPTPEPESVSEGDTDLPNDNSTPGRVAVGGSATGAIGAAGDQDRFAVELEVGRTYQFDLTGSPGGGGTLTDTFFRAIYNSEGQYQADSYNDDFDGGRDSRVTFTATESGTYYARVSGDRDEVGSYTLSVTDVTQ